MTRPVLYRGRFAPSPTGPLHFGSLVAATASYLQAKHQHGEWLVRIDDIDPPREVAGAADHILITLEQFGFEWDGEVSYQSHHQKRYAEAVSELLAQKQAYPCSCSRTSILNKTGLVKGAIIYPGFCRNGPLHKSSHYTIRLCCEDHVIEFTDAIQGKLQSNLLKDYGDFVLQRRDGYFSYHLASGIDDAEQQITEVVRGADLLNCTAAQIEVQHALKLSSPDYCHLPIALNNRGQKLSKQNHAKAIMPDESSWLLYKTLKFLGQMPPKSLKQASQEEIWSWALANWKLESVPQASPPVSENN